MKILQVIPYFCFGGAETMCENLTYALRNLGHEVTVVCLFDRPTPISRRMEEAGIPIHFLDKKLGLDLSMVPKLTKLMKTLRPDVVHTHLDVIKYAAAAARLAGVPKCIHTVHNVAEKEAEGRVQKCINGTYFRLGWSVPVALSPEVRKTVSDFYGLDLEKIPMVYNGVDLSRCIPKESYEAEKLKLVHVGRFNAQKNHAGLLWAFRQVVDRIPDAQLHLLGEGELLEQTQALARELGLEKNIRFLGSQSNIYPHLHEADIFLLPSLYEGMPMTIIEAMGTGLPIVATRVGGVPDMIRDRESGLLTLCDPEEVSSAILELAASQALRRKLGETARQESQRFSAAYMAREYARIYEQ